MDDYLCCIASGMIQFVCVREGKETYRSLTADHITIHPGSSMFRQNPLYIVAGEIVKTSRMFAMSVSPLTRALLDKIDESLESRLSATRGKKGRFDADETEESPRTSRRKGAKEERSDKKTKGDKANENIIAIGGINFELQKIKGKKVVRLPWNELRQALRSGENCQVPANIRGVIQMPGNAILMAGEKMELIFKAAKVLNLTPMEEGSWSRKMNLNIFEGNNISTLVSALDCIMRVAIAKGVTKELGFVTLYTNGNGSYWFKVSRGFITALNESLSSLEKLIDDSNNSAISPVDKEKINIIYRLLNSMYD